MLSKEQNALIEKYYTDICKLLKYALKRQAFKKLRRRDLYEEGLGLIPIILNDEIKMDMMKREEDLPQMLVGRLVWRLVDADRIEFRRVKIHQKLLQIGRKKKLRDFLENSLEYRDFEFRDAIENVDKLIEKFYWSKDNDSKVVSMILKEYVIPKSFGNKALPIAEIAKITGQNVASIYKILNSENVKILVGKLAGQNVKTTT